MRNNFYFCVFCALLKQDFFGYHSGTCTSSKVMEGCGASVLPPAELTRRAQPGHPPKRSRSKQHRRQSWQWLRFRRIIQPSPLLLWHLCLHSQMLRVDLSSCPLLSLVQLGLDCQVGCILLLILVHSNPQPPMHAFNACIQRLSNAPSSPFVPM